MSNEKKWTPEPWSTDERYPGRVYCDDATGSIVAQAIGFNHVQRPDEECIANSHRIAACVNFLANHPDLTQCEVVRKDEIAQLRQQRDELADALKEARVFVVNFYECQHDEQDQQIVLSQVDAALAKVTP